MYYTIKFAYYRDLETVLTKIIYNDIFSNDNNKQKEKPFLYAILT